MRTIFFVFSAILVFAAVSFAQNTSVYTPTSDKICKAQKIPEAGDYRIAISDLHGNVLLEQSAEAGALFNVPVQDYPPGLYSILVYSNSGIRVGKFVKM